MARAPSLERSLVLPSPGRWLVGAIVLALMLAVWPLIGASFSRAFAALTSGAFGELEFGRGGHATLVYAPAHAASLDASWNVQLELSIDGVEARHAVRVNPQRMLYLPLCFFFGFMALVPLSVRRRVLCLSLGTLALSLVATMSLWIMAAWLFARVPGLVYELTASEADLLHMSYEGFVTSTADKFIVPLFLALLLGLWQSPSPPVVPPKIAESAQKARKSQLALPRTRRRKTRHKR